VAAPDRAWVTDITYIRTLEGFAYLAVVIDLYSRRVVGWSIRAGRLICPLLSGPKLMIFWITKETRYAEQKASPGRDYRQAA
jgi:putative transposase